MIRREELRANIKMKVLREKENSEDKDSYNEKILMKSQFGCQVLESMLQTNAEKQKYETKSNLETKYDCATNKVESELVPRDARGDGRTSIKENAKKEYSEMHLMESTKP